MGHFLKTFGVAVIQNVFSPEECTAHMAERVEGHFKISPGLRTEWTDDKTPPGPRSGLFQNTSIHFPPVWRVRTDARVRQIFEASYGALRGKPFTDFVTSCDGINIRPPGPPYFDEAESRDWAHLDQTTSKIPGDDTNPFLCVQGQAVLSNSTACFRCSPGSVNAFEAVSEHTRANYARAGARSNWNLFKQHQYDGIRKLVLEAGGTWQIPVQSPRGSIILWLSSTVHSARLQTAEPPRPTPSDPYNGWRGVVYVCLRPQEDVDDEHIKRMEFAVKHNRCSNHWGERLFPCKSRGKRVPEIRRYMANPVLVRKDFPELAPKMTPELLALIKRQKRSGSRGDIEGAEEAKADSASGGAVQSAKL